MRLGITAKLFLALLATSVVVALATGVFTRLSFTRGFLGYLNDQGIQRVEALLPSFSEAYVEHGNWDFLRDSPRAWFRLINPRPNRGEERERERRQLPPFVLTGVDTRLSLLDAQRQYVAGNPALNSETAMRPVIAGGRTVGWLAVIPFQSVTTAADVKFQERQLKALWIIGSGSILLAGVLAIWMTRRLLAPVKRIANATHQLAAGDYAGRLEISSSDEIGRLAEDFNQLARTLERNEQMRRAFMADVSHELRTPLAVLRGELEAIEDGVRTLTPESLRSLQAEVGTLSKLVSDLYDLSLSDVGALTYRKIDVDVGDILQSALGAYHDRLTEQGITVDAQIPEPGPIVKADEGRLRQLFSNILENTLRYTYPGGRLSIQCRREARHIQIDFCDSEPGVPEDVLPRLFERFFRTEASRNRATGGAGLGLAICKNIVEAHGGAIVAKPSPLGGVCISISLPHTGQ